MARKVRRPTRKGRTATRRLLSLDELESGLFSVEEIAQLHREVEAEILEMNLAELRRVAGKTQKEVAATTRMSQPELSRVERRQDHLLSTLRRYVEALGGEVEVVARFGRKSVRLVGV
jgi:hypothetical protein